MARRELERQRQEENYRSISKGSVPYPPEKDGKD